MSRWFKAAVLVAASVVLHDARAQAQFLVVGYGSTVDGDIARGNGIYLLGMGQYNLNSAMAYGILSDALLREQVAIDFARTQMARQYHARVSAQVEANARLYQARHERILDRPTSDDIARGDALNALVRKLADATFASPSTLRAASLPVPGGTIENAPLALPSAGVMIARSRLVDRSSWPLLLREPEFDADFRSYHAAVDAALEAVADGPLRVEAVDRIDRAVRALRDRLLRVVEDARPADRREALAFLDGLGRSVEFFRVTRAERVLAEIGSYGGTTVGDLVEFLARRDLQFAPATTPAERELYRALHPTLARQWEAFRQAENARAEAEPPARR